MSANESIANDYEELVELSQGEADSTGCNLLSNSQTILFLEHMYFKAPLRIIKEYLISYEKVDMKDGHPSTIVTNSINGLNLVPLLKKSFKDFDLIGNYYQNCH